MSTAKDELYKNLVDRAKSGKVDKKMTLEESTPQDRRNVDVARRDYSRIRSEFVKENTNSEKLRSR